MVLTKIQKSPAKFLVIVLDFSVFFLDFSIICCNFSAKFNKCGDTNILPSGQVCDVGALTGRGRPIKLVSGDFFGFLCIFLLNFSSLLDLSVKFYKCGDTNIFNWGFAK